MSGTPILRLHQIDVLPQFQCQRQHQAQLQSQAAYLPASLPACLSSYLPVCLLVLRSFACSWPACLPACLPACQCFHKVLPPQIEINIKGRDIEWSGLEGLGGGSRKKTWGGIKTKGMNFAVRLILVATMQRHNSVQTPRV